MSTVDPLVVDGAVQIAMDYTTDAGDMCNVLGFNIGEGAFTAFEVGNVVQSWWTAFQSTMVSTVNMVGGRGIDLRSFPHLTPLGIAPAVTVGTNSGAPAPDSACKLIALGTAGAGRRARGRIFLGGGGADDQDSGHTWGSGHIGEVLIAWEAFVADLPEGWTPAVISRKFAESHDVTAFLVRSYICSQRGRLEH